MKLLQIIILVIVLSSCSQKEKFSLLTYNIRNAKGMDNKTDPSRIVQVIRSSGANVIGLQELDSVTKRNKIDLLKLLADSTGMFHLYAAAITFQDGKYGVGLLSKEKALNHYSIPLPGKEEQRVLLVAEFKKYVVFNTHLSLTKADRLTSVQIINEQARKFKKPIYLLGDMNAEPNDSVIINLQKDWKLLSPLSFTFPATKPDRCIDYIFSRNANAKVRSAEVIDEAMASDHRPVLVRLR